MPLGFCVVCSSVAVLGGRPNHGQWGGEGPTCLGNPVSDHRRAGRRPPRQRPAGHTTGVAPRPAGGPQLGRADEPRHRRRARRLYVAVRRGSVQEFFSCLDLGGQGGLWARPSHPLRGDLVGPGRGRVLAILGDFRVEALNIFDPIFDPPQKWVPLPRVDGDPQSSKRKGTLIRPLPPADSLWRLSENPQG